MSQCVPNWDLSEPPPSAATTRPPFHPSSAAHDAIPMFEYEVAELTWENGQLALHGLGLPKLSSKFQYGGGGKDTWDNKLARGSGTLESLVNQGTTRQTDRKIIGANTANDLVPWFADHHSQLPQTKTLDAMVPCHGNTALVSGGGGKAATETNDIPVAARVEDEHCHVVHAENHGKRARVAKRVVQAEGEWGGCRNQISESGSATAFRREISEKVTQDTHESDSAIVGGGRGFTATPATSQGSLDNTSSDKPFIKTTTTEDHDSICHSTHQVDEEYEEHRKKEKSKSSVSTKRSRAAAIHNQSERKRRDKINQKMMTLQKMVPNSNKTDKASMLDEVIEYLKQLQAQVQMMSRMNMPAMMLPMAMQQQLPMAPLMAPMGMGMGMPGMNMGMSMDHLNMMASRSGLAAGMSPLLHPAAFMACDQLQQPSPTTMIADPFSAFLACQSQPLTMEAYSRMAMMFQQLHQQASMAGGSKK